MDPQAEGYLAASIAILFFGSFGIPIKSKRVVEAGIDPVVFQCYYSFAVFLTSWLLLAFYPFQFTYLGIVGALLWVPSSILSIFAVNFLGISIAQGTWSGITIMVSFIWGAAVFHDEVKNLWLAILALLLLALGITGLSLCQYKFYNPFSPSMHNEYDPLMPVNESEKPVEPSKNRMLGILCAVFLGILNGSMLVPLRYLPKDFPPLVYPVSFGIGVMVVTPVAALLYFVVKRKRPELKPTVAAIPGMLSGTMWNVGNVGSVIATLKLGLTIGFPLTQLALLVAGIWGMVLFGELAGKLCKVQFFIAAVVLLGGAACLAFFG
eukprot:TRINITY_DN2219_c0_g2_i2.p1 TRINITY_DN2219_c0_g2~~TRINITY_DN2219_c0_g2_i2.p1  ORF type:complete len:322 (-),score=46.00 TRINITY_DN2219_c0_g2_i2:155-1120(-)